MGTLRPAHGLLRPTQSPLRSTQGPLRLTVPSPRPKQAGLRLIRDQQALAAGAGHTHIGKGLSKADKRRSQSTKAILTPVIIGPLSQMLPRVIFLLQLIQYSSKKITEVGDWS